MESFVICTVKTRTHCGHLIAKRHLTKSRGIASDDTTLFERDQLVGENERWKDLVDRRLLQNRGGGFDSDARGLNDGVFGLQSL